MIITKFSFLINHLSHQSTFSSVNFLINQLSHQSTFSSIDFLMNGLSHHSTLSSIYFLINRLSHRLTFSSLAQLILFKNVFIYRLVCQPLDVAKIRLQLQVELGQARKYKNLIELMLKLPREEGVAALWKGSRQNH